MEAYAGYRRRQRPIHIEILDGELQAMMDELVKVVGREAYYAWSQTLPAWVIMSDGRYIEAIKQKLQEESDVETNN